MENNMSIKQARRRIRVTLIGKHLVWALTRAAIIAVLFVLLTFVYQNNGFGFIASVSARGSNSIITPENIYLVLQRILYSLIVWFFLVLSKKIIIPASIIAISPAVGKIVRNPLATKKFNRSMSRYLTYVIHFIVIGSLIFIWTYHIIGSWITDFLGNSLIIALTFVLGLFSSSVLGNILGYAIIGETHEFETGDRVQIGNVYGDVVDVGFFFTHIRTLRDEIVSIPNLTVMNTEIHNFSVMQRVALSVQVTLGYDVDKDYAQSTLIEAALKTKGILPLSDKAPFVLLRELGAYSITYELNAFTAEPNRLMQIRSELIGNMITELNKAGIVIMTPTVVTIKSEEKTLLHP